MQYSAAGTAYVVSAWFLILVEFIILGIRLYSRTLLTRSIGSDDFFIVIGVLLDVVAISSDFQAFLHGWSQHESALSSAQYSQFQKWRYISWLQYYMVFFFVRASVQLFVLRLLPSYKKWQQTSVYLAFAINFLVTLYACITFGVSCRPFRARWEDVPNSKCFPTNLLVITNRVNAALSCLCDVATAVIPIFLLWNVKMRATTKRQLNVLFGLSLVTGALSIGRAASVTRKGLTEDTTWNSIRSYYVCMFEVKLGIIVACGPALRQFWAYRKRTKSWLPTKKRQYPNEDFEKMRYRINLRDIFWYRKAPMVGDRVYEAARIFRNKSPPPDASSGDPQSSTKVKNSVLDIWKKRIQNVMNFYHNDENESTSNSAGQAKTLKQNPSEHSDKPTGKWSNGRGWNLFQNKAVTSTESSTQAPSQRFDSELETSVTLT